MTDKLEKYKFPDIPSTGAGYPIPDYRNRSLLHSDNTVTPPPQPSLCSFLLRALLTPMAKTGWVIACLALILILTPVPAALLWIGRGGMLVAATLIGFSLFSSSTSSAHNHTGDESLDDGYNHS